MNNVDSQKIMGMLSEIYRAPEWLAIPELRAGTGYSLLDAIDLFAVSCFAKAGYGYSIAFEVKVSRQDYSREIRCLDKNSIFWRNCNQFYFVTPPGLLNDDEIPEGRGLMEAGKRIVIKKIAPRKDIDGFMPIFFTSILKSILEKNGYWGVGKEKLFKYAGQEITREELIKIGINEQQVSEKDREREAFKKYKVEFDARANNDFKKLAEGVAKIVNEKWIEGYEWSNELYGVDRLIGDVRALKVRADKSGLTARDIDEALRVLSEAETIMKRGKQVEKESFGESNEI